MSRGLGKIILSIFLTVLWVCCFLFIGPSYVKAALIVIVPIIIVLEHIFYPSSAEVTKLSLTVVLTMAWLALMIFYHFQPLQGTEAEAAAGVEYDGAIGFFALVGGLAVCVLWIRFFSDEVSLEDKK